MCEAGQGRGYGRFSIQLGTSGLIVLRESKTVVEIEATGRVARYILSCLGEWLLGICEFETLV